MYVSWLLSTFRYPTSRCDFAKISFYHTTFRILHTEILTLLFVCRRIIIFVIRQIESHLVGSLANMINWVVFLVTKTWKSWVWTLLSTLEWKDKMFLSCLDTLEISCSWWKLKKMWRIFFWYVVTTVTKTQIWILAKHLISHLGTSCYQSSYVLVLLSTFVYVPALVELPSRSYIFPQLGASYNTLLYFTTIRG